MVIRDLEHLDEIGTNWSNRARNLFDYAFNESKPNKKRAKAFIMANAMRMKVLYLRDLYLKQISPIPKFKKGCVAILPNR